MVNAVSYITFLQLFYTCDGPPSYRRTSVFILVVIIFQLLKACNVILSKNTHV